MKNCNECEYFKRFYTHGDKVYTATMFGLCAKRRRTVSDKYYCSNLKNRKEAINE